MMGRIMAIVLVLCFVGHARADGHLPDEMAVKAIKASAATWSVLYAKRDLDTLMTLYHPDAKLFSNGQPGLFGRDAIRGYFAESFKNTTGANIDFKVEDITVFGDVANLVSLYIMEIDVGKDAPVVVAGRSMLMYKRDASGNWLIFADMDNQAPDATVQAFKDARR